MKKHLLLFSALLLSYMSGTAQTCGFDRQITTTDSVLCAGELTTLSFNAVNGAPVDTVVPTPIVNNNGQDGNMFDITASNTVRIRYFEGLIANTPNAVTDYYIYYKVGSHVGFENNSAAWTLIAGPISFAVNAPNTMTVIPVNMNITIPAGQTYAFYLTNTSAISNNNRYHNGTATGVTLAANSDLTVKEGTGGAYPFGTFFNARPWEGIVHYDYPPVTYLWSTGDTTSSISVQPATTQAFSCVANVGSSTCFVEDTITVQVNALPVVALNDTAICQGVVITLDAGNAGAAYLWCDGTTTQTMPASIPGMVCVSVTDTNGCVNGDAAMITVNPLPSVITTNDTVCEGSSATLSASGSSAVYTWEPGTLSGDTISIVPAAAFTTYTVTAVDTNGCIATGMASVSVNPKPAVVLPAYGPYCVYNADVLLTGASPGAGIFSGAGISGDTLSPAAAGAGTHTIVYTYTEASTGCSSSDSVDVLIDVCTGIVSQLTEQNVHIYPNPFSSSATLTVDAGVVHDNATLLLYDISGKKVMELPVNGSTVVIARGDLQSGVYFYHLMNNGIMTGSGKLIAD